MNFTAQFAADYYKLFHQIGAHEDIDFVYENFTNRSGRLCNVEGNSEVCTVGVRGYIQNILINQWNDTFFRVDKKKAVKRITRIAKKGTGNVYDASHFEALHDLGYLPISMKALPEGSLVSYQVANMTMTNTVKGFGWLVGYLETVQSQENWGVQTTATTAVAYLKRVKIMAAKTGLPEYLVPYMCHDFSARGMFGQGAAALSSFGMVAAGFAGTDTMQVVDIIEDLYGMDLDDYEDCEIIASVSATEHSIATSAILIEMSRNADLTFDEAEIMYASKLMSIVPKGILSYVADSFDFWGFVTRMLPILKEQIMAREGKFVVRPDSGDPVKIITGYLNVLDLDDGSDLSANLVDYTLGELTKYCRIHGHEAINVLGKFYSAFEVNERGNALELQEAEVKGLMQCLIDEFGFTRTEQGYKLLPDQIGAIYGDAITLARQDEIYTRLEKRNIVPSIVLGVGSYSFQYVTRDTNGSAIKATMVTLNDGEMVEVFKDPKTDSKKKSAKGLLRIERENGVFVQYDQQTIEQETQGWLVEIFRDGEYLGNADVPKIRSWVSAQIDEQFERGMEFTLEVSESNWGGCKLS